MRQALSSWPKKLPPSQFASACTTMDGARRRRPSATLGETCSSSRSRSISTTGRLAGRELVGLRQHPLQGFKIDRVVLGDGFLNLFRKRAGIVHCREDFSLGPLQVPCHRRRVILITAQQKHDLPNRERAALHVGAATG